MDCVGIGRLIATLFDHHLHSSNLYRFVFCKRCIASSKEATYEKGVAEVQRNLKQRILELRSQFDREKRNSYRSRFARHSCDKLKMEILKLENQGKSAVAAQPSESAPCFLSLEVLSNGTAQLNPSCFIRTPHRSYLFNCPEGSTRMMASMRIKPNQINDIFITSAVWDNFGGINSFLMSRDKGETVRIHSSVGIRNYFDCIRPFADSDIGHINYPVQIDERSLLNDAYEDSAIRVNYLPLRISKNSPTIDYGSSPLPHSSLNQIFRTDVAFLVELLQPPRRINALKLIELGIPNGPHIALLKDGHEVNLDGRIVKPDDVSFPIDSTVQPTILIVECSGTAYFPSLRDSLLLQEFMNGSKSLNFCVHFTPEKVFSCAEYKEWMSKFGHQCKHIVLNGTGPKLPHLEGVHRQQRLFRSFAPFLFPSLTPDCNDIIGQDDECETIGNVLLARPLQRFILRKKSSINDLVVCNLNGADYLSQDLSADTVREIEAFKKATENVDASTSSPALIFLGTSSAASTKYRNVSGLVLKVTNDSYIMIDCGEGTYGQLRVLFGDEACADILVRLHAILITHAHTDHVNGLYTMLMRRKAAFETKGLKFKKVVLVCCPSVARIFDMYCRAFSDLYSMVELVSCVRKQVISVKQSGMKSPLSPVDCNELTFDMIGLLPGNLYNEQEWGIKSIRIVRVHHTRLANGYIISSTKGQKFVFSGDTKPCQLLAEYGKGADVLVHEATFEDSRERDAIGKRHSTMWQAAEIGRRMNAKYIILTHFSSRYAKVPALPSYLDRCGNIGVACDNLLVHLNQAGFLPKLLPVYRELFKNELFEMETKSHQQRLKREYSSEIDDRTPVSRGKKQGIVNTSHANVLNKSGSRKRKAASPLNS